VYQPFAASERSVVVTNALKDGFAKLRQVEGWPAGWSNTGNIPPLGSFLPGRDSLGTLSEVMEMGGPGHRTYARPSRISASSRRLHDVIIETGRFDRRCSFLIVMKILSGDANWHSYLREPWTFDCLSHPYLVGGLPLSEYGGPNSPPPDKLEGYHHRSSETRDSRNYPSPKATGGQFCLRSNG